MGPRFKPASVGFFRLLPNTKRKAQGTAANFFDIQDQTFHVGNEFLVLTLPTLQGQRSVTLIISPLGHGKKIFIRRVKAFHLFIIPADAAVFAILDTAIGKFQEAPVMVNITNIFEFYGISRIIKFLSLSRVRCPQKGHKVTMGQGFFL